MNKTSGRGTAGVVIMLAGVGLIASALSGGSYASVLPGLIVIWLGLAVRGASKKQQARPRVPPGFTAAHADRIEGQVREQGEQQSPEAMPQEFGYAPGPQPAPPRPAAASVSPAPRTAVPATPPVGGTRTGSDAGSDTPGTGVAPSSTSEPAVPRMVRAQVVKLAKAGRTVEAIDVLREATGMELYEASQYVRKARQSAS